MVNWLDSQQARSSVSNNIILLFVDGVGIGIDDPAINPCCNSTTGIFHVNSNLSKSGLKFPIDAQLGVPGLPQSATGHSTIYTGRNAPELIGKHLTGFPNKELRYLLEKHSLFVKLKNLDFTCKFINAFRPIFFTTPEIFSNLHMSATTEMNKYAGYDFSDFQDIKNEMALYHDFSNEENRNRGFDLPLFTADKAGEILVRESVKYDLILYEYFLTDFAGHAQNMERSIREVRKVENLILAVLKYMDFDNTILIVASDHGNIEDVRTKSHTTNPAFLGIWDRTTTNTYSEFKSLQDIYPYILYKITGNNPAHTEAT
jgi:2,3-bisphosphoglycerate-independent phosphoglycerate mutase